MLSEAAARKLLFDCIETVTGQRPGSSSKIGSLKDLAIRGRLVGRLRTELRAAMKERRTPFSPQQLRFDEGTSVESIIKLLAARSTVKKGAEGRPRTTDPSPPVRSGRRWTLPHVPIVAPLPDGSRRGAIGFSFPGPMRFGITDRPIITVTSRNTQSATNKIAAKKKAPPKATAPKKLAVKKTAAKKAPAKKAVARGLLSEGREVAFSETQPSIRKVARVGGKPAGVAGAGNGSFEPRPRTSDEPDPKPASQKFRTVNCTPQMEKTRELEAGKLYELEVYLDQGREAPGADVKRGTFTIEEDLTEFAVDVWFDSSSGLEIVETGAEPKLLVQAMTGVSDRFPFQVKIDPSQVKDPRNLFLSALFRFRGRPSGKITRFVTLDGGGFAWRIPASKAQPAGEVVLPAQFGDPAVALEAGARLADLRVEVLRTEENDGRHFRLSCFHADKHWSGAWNFPQATKDLVNAYMQRFIDAQGKARINRLKAAGTEFWNVIPAPARDFILSAIEAGAKSMSILSEEPYIPWELMIPQAKGQDERPSLGVDLRVGRWITGNYVSAPQSIPMRSIHIVCPKTSGLENSGEELNFLKGLAFKPNTPIAPVTYDDLDAGLQASTRDIIHFICHGKSADIQTLELDNSDTIDCSEVREMPGFRHAFQGGSLAFLNACEVGRQELALNGVGGFANSFIELGASAVIAPLWSVQDSAAYQVAVDFYKRALTKVPFSEIMKSIRERAYKEAIDSFAAYCFYGDPEAHCAPE